jgi:penicillin G amidase
MVDRTWCRVRPLSGEPVKRSRGPVSIMQVQSCRTNLLPANNVGKENAFMPKVHLNQPDHSARLFNLPTYVLSVLVVATPVLASPQSTVPTETVTVPNLQQSAEILIDHWGVPHIYAKNEADLFFAQGFNAARDRLFQIDLWRRRGLGQLAEVFGSAFVEQDKATRLFLYRGDMNKEWAVCSADAEQIAQHFAAGINAYIDWLDEHPDKVPFEFKKLNYKPARWAAEDVVRIRSHGLTRNLTDEVARAKVACAGDLKADEIRYRLEPPWQTRIPEGLDPCLPKDVLKVFSLATQDVRITRESTTVVSSVSSQP